MVRNVSDIKKFSNKTYPQAPQMSDFPIVKVAPSSNKEHGRTVLKRSLRPLLTISQLACAAPFHIKALDPDSNYGRVKIFAIGTMQLLWGAMLLFAGFVAVSYKKQWRLQQSNMPFFTYILYNVDLYLGLANSLMIFVVCQRQRGGYDEIVTTMEKLSADQSSVEKDSTRLRNMFSKLLLIAVVHLVLLGTFEFIHTGELTKLSTTLAAQFVPNVVQVFSLMQYAYVLMFIYLHYKAINGALVAMAEVFKSDLTSCSNSLNALKQQHHQLHLLAFRVNELYGMLIVMSAISVLVGTSITCLEVYQFTKNTELFREWGIHAVLGVLWGGLYIGRIVLILYPNHLVENEVKRSESEAFS